MSVLYNKHIVGLFHIFFFNDTETTEIYTLSLHDALPIYDQRSGGKASDVGEECHVNLG